MENDHGRFDSIDAYIAAFPEDVQTILKELRATIKAAAPDAEEKISYQMPTFVQQGNLVHFAAYGHHVGFYPTPSAIQAFAQELAIYPSAKGSVRFPLGAPLPLDLISRIVKFRVAENLKAAELKSNRRRRS